MHVYTCENSEVMVLFVSNPRQSKHATLINGVCQLNELLPDVQMITRSQICSNGTINNFRI